MPRLSIVIPCLGGAAEFDGTLVSVLQNRPADCEVLVVHTERYDDPYDLADEVEFYLPGCRTLTGLINAGLEQAEGEIVHIVGCGLEVTEGWTDAAMAHFDDDDVAAVSPVVLAADGQTLVSAGLRFTRGGRRKLVSDRRLLSPGAGRLRASVLGPSLTAGFYRREVLAALDGLDESLGDTHADAGLALAIRSLGGLHVCEPAARLIQRADSISVDAACFTAGRAEERLFCRQASELGWPLSLALHSFTVAGSLIAGGIKLANCTSLLGRTIAWAELGGVKRHEQRLATARQRLEEVAASQATIRLPVSQPPSAAAERRRAA